MHWWQAVILGLVEGITEYLPVSSTGHLILAQRALGFSASEAANAFAVCIQAGAILAVLGIYLPRVMAMVQGLRGRDPAGRQLLFATVVAFAPAAAIGVVLDKRIEHYLFGLWPVVAAWLGWGLVILYLSRPGGLASPSSTHPGAALEQLDARRALLIGLFQCFALWPGTSRSLVTILGGLVVGLSLPAAVEFSFILGLLTLSAATGYKALKGGAVMLHTYGSGNVALGFAVAALAAFVAVRWMVAYLSRHGLGIFGYYRIALALAVGGLILGGVLS